MRHSGSGANRLPHVLDLAAIILAACGPESGQMGSTSSDRQRTKLICEGLPKAARAIGETHQGLAAGGLP